MHPGRGGLAARRYDTRQRVSGERRHARQPYAVVSSFIVYGQLISGAEFYYSPLESAVSVEPLERSCAPRIREN